MASRRSTCDSGIHRAATTPTTRIGSRFTAKTERHPKTWVSSPPRTGPAARNTVAPVETMPSAHPRRSSGTTSVALAYPRGTTSAAPTPCTPRPPISTPAVGASAHTAEPTAKIPAPNKNVRRRPCTSASRPAAAINDASASRYAPITHCSSRLDRPRSA